MILNREAKTTGSMCIALLRRIMFKVEEVNGVHLLGNMEIIKHADSGRETSHGAHILIWQSPNRSKVPICGKCSPADFVGVFAQR